MKAIICLIMVIVFNVIYTHNLNKAEANKDKDLESEIDNYIINGEDKD